MSEAKTLGELKKNGIEVLSVRDEMRKNLVRHIESGERILPGIIGYDETVIPEIEKLFLPAITWSFSASAAKANRGLFAA